VTIPPVGAGELPEGSEQPSIAKASQSVEKMRAYFIPILYWQKIKPSSKVVFESCVIYNHAIKLQKRIFDH
jgi:hypothetical protein